MIRDAKPRDLSKLTDLAVEALNRHPHERLVVDRDKVAEIARECITGKAHFFVVAEENGEIVGGLASYTTPLIFHERNETTVMMFYFKNGEGMKAFRRFVQWTRERPIIKMISITGFGSAALDSRVLRIMSDRYGFESVPLMYRVR